ncbi:MAG: type IV secretion system DNA-binding domain-containing protein [Steroidobacteraceae bacterium]
MNFISDSRGVVLVAGLAVALIAFTRIRGRQCADIHKRGALLRDGVGRRRRRARFTTSNTGVSTLAGVPIPIGDETKHFKLIGTTGTGKSTAIRELMSSALARGDRAVFADPDGGYHRAFFDRRRGDLVLNPFEKGSVKWDLFAELKSPYDVEELASGLIPSSSDASASEWRAYARTFVGAVVRGCLAKKRHDCAEFWRLLAVAPSEELQSLVAGTPAQPFLDPENARMFGSIRAVAVSAMAAFEHVQAQRAAAFSVREWVRSKTNPGLLFIPYKAGQIAALKYLIATWLRLAIFETMSADEGHDQRLWFVIDELDALGAIAGLKDALARLRKFGGRCVLGFQSAAQVSSTYGAGDAQTVIENCGNTLILRCSSGETGGTSEFASRLIGEREIVRRQISHGSDREAVFPARGARRSRNRSEQHVTERAVMASQIEQLPDLSGYLKSASSRAWLKVAISPDRCPLTRRSRTCAE